MISIQKSAGVFGDSYEFPHLRTYSVELFDIVILLLLLVPPLYRGELSFLQLVHFCICWHDSAMLTGYLFRQWSACVHVPNWKNKCPGSQRYTVADIPPMGSGEYEQFPTLQYPTEIHVTLRSTSWSNPKTEKKPQIQFSFYSDRGGLFFPREIVTQPSSEARST